MKKAATGFHPFLLVQDNINFIYARCIQSPFHLLVPRATIVVEWNASLCGCLRYQ